ncbi:hypothetical protein [Xanthomonas graminis]|jgi:hypothetical protein|uniref:Uncharacterized protein n=1 Tax=Xanthomonas graminis pv. graminis TaxID=134874 RepID=A0A1M4IC74_9XANT|nr:hypothetical protein [Xanthomonas translucens]EKU26313.1 hypothetical protein XTG29_00561 [Xanthomonas translucens pv. graminis ART-Xtg29]OAX60001.1 hypothetical protein A6R72_15575 [Xanthomonas translucens pv. graminis]UKE53758.1 hypothetical protein KFS84_16100 [Xanthomonas translucens pv. graminis]WIH08075.1 hypothetical protein KM579_16660 [Xanthomonas translucens pv. graminis]WIH13170.1 hypothetical protein KM563_05360 [Xanthomonas translucens pv. graminis]
MPPDPDLRRQFRALAAHTDGIDTALYAKDAFWASASRFRAHITVGLHTETGTAHCFKRYPLPPPSPLNQTWFKRFPALRDARLRQLQR